MQILRLVICFFFTSKWKYPFVTMNLFQSDTYYLEKNHMVIFKLITSIIIFNEFA